MDITGFIGSIHPKNPGTYRSIDAASSSIYQTGEPMSIYSKTYPITSTFARMVTITFPPSVGLGFVYTNFPTPEPPAMDDASIPQTEDEYEEFIERKQQEIKQFKATTRKNYLSALEKGIWQITGSANVTGVLQAAVSYKHNSRLTFETQAASRLSANFLQLIGSVRYDADTWTGKASFDQAHKEVNLNIFARVNSNIAVGGEIGYSIPRKQPNASIGLRYRQKTINGMNIFCATTSVMGENKVSFTTDFTPQLRLTNTIGFNANSFESYYRCGAQFDLSGAATLGGFYGTRGEYGGVLSVTTPFGHFSLSGGAHHKNGRWLSVSLMG
eukprot:TRINITY_DN4001_c0_g1_i1.p1 TRINITY_DN4001_c0_g1~~TRINITY_DN4001_c0_g1_i1.p1  ORF type:complete len:336 (-),score=79.50 TRINITY_DN4001_c0_g1_i1:42-1025(-)